MHMHLEKTISSQTDCVILSLSWMGKVPEEEVNDGWRLNRSNYYEDGWIATGNVHGIVSVTFTTSHGRKMRDLPQRANYNLRGHHSRVVLVKWNEPYQKLASCDSTGVIYVWIKFEGRWSVELINDRNIQVTDFAWSHDGRMALICYSDSFILVGSVSGQRYWSSVVNAGSSINCGIWSPDDKQVMFGTANGSILVIDVSGNIVAQISIMENVPITGMCWSAEKFNMDENADRFKNAHNKEAPLKLTTLAICFKNGHIYLMRSYDDVSPVIIDTGLKGIKVEWSNGGDILAVIGFVYVGYSATASYLNKVKFYCVTGEPCLVVNLPYTKSPVYSLTWGHNDKRLFICVANHIYVGWITKKMPSLQLLSRIVLYTALEDEYCVKKLKLPHCLQSRICNLFGPTIKCYLPDPDSLRDFVSTPPPNDIRLYCTMMRHEENSSNNSMTYTLFLEYLGGLVPILKGKRASKLRPEFIIYDPHHPDKDMRKLNAFQVDLSSKMSNVPMSANASAMRVPASSSDSDFDDNCASPKMQRQRRKKRLEPGRTRDWSIIAEREMFTDHLPEQKKIVSISSNIWGTKFKVLGLAAWLPQVLGTVTYRTSVLHLQPRQMTLIIKELRGPQFAQEISPNSSRSLALFMDEEEDANDLESQPCRENAPIAPMTPQKGPHSNNVGKYYHNTPSKPRASENRILNNSGNDANSTVPASSGSECIPSCSSDIVPSTNAHCADVHSNGHSLCSNIPLYVDISSASPSSFGIFERSKLAADESATLLPSYFVSSPSSAGSCHVQGNNFLEKMEVDSNAPNCSSIFSASSVSSINTDVELGSGYYIPSEVSSNCSFDGTRPKSSISERSAKSKSILDNTEFLEKASHSFATPESSCCAKKTPDPKIRVSSSSNRGKQDSQPHASGTDSNTYKNVTDKMKYIDDDLDENDEIFVFCSNNETLNVHCSSSSNQASSMLFDVCRGHNYNDKERRVTLKDPNTNPENIYCRHCHGDEMMHENSTQKYHGYAYNTLMSSDLFCSCESRDSSYQKQTKNDPFLNGKQVASSSRSSSDSINANDSISDLTSLPKHYRDHRASVPHVDKLRSANIVAGSRSIPSSPETRRKPTEKQSIFYSPLFLRKNRAPKTNETSDDEVAVSSEEIRAMEFKDLESFQKAYIKKKLKKWRGRTVADGPPNDNKTVKFNEFLLHNKAPLWNEVSQVYQLDFGGRVTQESAKNFQIEFHGKQVMQFGRIDGSAYSLDFQYPFSALQAFAVALANVTQRLK